MISAGPHTFILWHDCAVAFKSGDGVDVAENMLSIAHEKGNSSLAGDYFYIIGN